MHAIAKITAKGQTTIPQDVRAALRVTAGDLIAWEVGADGTATVASDGEGAILDLAQRAQALFESGRADEAQQLIAQAEHMAGAMRAN